ncbi:MAG: hypothetical protein HY320_12310 [Armatimonadetes bacterium]|nr:hypothetical protein [Armatimonadota bacterium]
MRSKHYVSGRKQQREVERAARRVGQDLAGEHRRILARSAMGWSQAEIARALGTEVAYIDAVLDGLTERLRVLIGYYPSKQEPGRVFTFHDRRDTLAFAQERGWLSTERATEASAEVGQPATPPTEPPPRPTKIPRE